MKYVAIRQVYSTHVIFKKFCIIWDYEFYIRHKNSKKHIERGIFLLEYADISSLTPGSIRIVMFQKRNVYEKFSLHIVITHFPRLEFLNLKQYLIAGFLKSKN